MGRYLRASVCLLVFLVMACSHSPERVRQPKIPDGSTLAVIIFRECLIEGQEDCHSSGYRVALYFAQALSDKPRLDAVLIPRPVGNREELSDDAAVAYAKDKGYAYVVNGEVTDYFYAPQISFQKHRAALVLRVLRTSDGQVVYSYAGADTGNLSSPLKMFRSMGSDLQSILLDD